MLGQGCCSSLSLVHFREALRFLHFLRSGSLFPKRELGMIESGQTERSNELAFVEKRVAACKTA